MTTYDRVFVALADADIRFVVVGGVAVVLHGHLRQTVDADLVIDLEDGEARRAMTVLVGLGLEPRLPVDALEFGDSATRQSWIEDRGMMVFTMLDPSDPFFELDLFVRYPRPFEDLFEQSKRLEVEGREVRIASIDHLIEMKRRAGRHKDLEDIDELEALRDD